MGFRNQQLERPGFLKMFQLSSKEASSAQEVQNIQVFMKLNSKLRKNFTAKTLRWDI